MTLILMFEVYSKMPTLLVKNGFKFFFYANEHEPKHIHVTKGDHFAKIELLTLRVVKNYFKPQELKKVLAIVQQYQVDFEERWDEYFKR